MTDKQDPIAHAARLLREAAEELRQAHAYNNSEGWENETDAKAAYDEHLAAAQALEDWEQAVGAGGVSGPLMGQPQAMPDLTALTERGAKAWTAVDAQALREGRWYMVTHDGVAALCEDRRDAEKEAKDADMAWPHSGPHRAVQLVEASTAGFTAADMATASAQGFRDGVASLSANAGEPRALTEDQWIDLAQRHANADWNSGRPDGFLNAVKALCLDYAAPPTAQAEGWMATAQHQTYRCKIKSRKQIDKEIPRDQQGWWADAAAGQKLLLRPAVQADIDRCHIGPRRSKNPDDYMCETQTNGSLVSKIALEYMQPEQNVFAAVPPPPTSAEGVEP